MISYRLPDSSCDKHFSSRKVFYIRHLHPSQRMALCVQESFCFQPTSFCFYFSTSIIHFPKPTFTQRVSTGPDCLSDSSNVIITGPGTRERPKLIPPPEWRNQALQPEYVEYLTKSRTLMHWTHAVTSRRRSKILMRSKFACVIVHLRLSGTSHQTCLT